MTPDEGQIPVEEAMAEEMLSQGADRDASEQTMSIGWISPTHRKGSIGCMVRMGDVMIGAVADDAASALHAASGLASELSATFDKHPELKALIPPQATAALAAIRVASYVAKEGRLPEAAKKLGPIAARTVRSLLKGIL